MLVLFSLFFFFNDTATTEIYPLSLHDALPIYRRSSRRSRTAAARFCPSRRARTAAPAARAASRRRRAGQKRSEEHTSELQSLAYLVCRLLLEKKKQQRLEKQSVQYQQREFECA